MVISSSCSSSRTDVAGRQGADLPRNGYRTRNAAAHPAAGCIDQGHAGATASGWAPLPSNVPFGAGPSASDHLQVRTKTVTHSPFVITRYKTQAAALALSASLPWRSITDSQTSPLTPKVRTHHITSQRHTHGGPCGLECSFGQPSTTTGPARWNEKATSGWRHRAASCPCLRSHGRTPSKHVGTGRWSIGGHLVPQPR